MYEEVQRIAVALVLPRSQDECLIVPFSGRFQRKETSTFGGILTTYGTVAAQPGRSFRPAEGGAVMSGAPMMIHDGARRRGSQKAVIGLNDRMKTPYKASDTLFQSLNCSLKRSGVVMRYSRSLHPEACGCEERCTWPEAEHLTVPSLWRVQFRGGKGGAVLPEVAASDQHLPIGERCRRNVIAGHAHAPRR